VAGLGPWGSNLARNFHELAELVWLCDEDESRLRAAAGRYPAARAAEGFDEVLEAPDVDAVVVATPVPTHAALARRALAAGKHVFVEKPMALGGAEAEALVALAEERGLVLMPGHLLLYHPGVAQLKALVDAGELGEEPAEVSARGESFLKEGVEDVVFCYLRFPSGTMAHMHLSWLDPHKMRRMTVVGTDKMAVFDDMELDRKVTVYDSAAEQSLGTYGEWSTRTGDIYSPRVPNAEPLRLECSHFLGLLGGNGDPLVAAREGLAVVRALEQLQASLERERV
jgi:predicted dehydrogenase